MTFQQFLWIIFRLYVHFNKGEEGEKKEEEKKEDENKKEEDEKKDGEEKKEDKKEDEKKNEDAKKKDDEKKDDDKKEENKASLEFYIKGGEREKKRSKNCTKKFGRKEEKILERKKLNEIIASKIT